jgi:hypothetical protein
MKFGIDITYIGEMCLSYVSRMAAILFQDGRHIGEILVRAVTQKPFVGF